MERNFGITNCVVTGSPAFDRFKNYDLAKKKQSVRKVLGLKDDEKLIVFLGQVSSQASEAPETLHVLTKCFKDLQHQDKIKFALRIHPREPNPELYFSALKNSSVGMIDKAMLSTEDSIIASDIVTTM